MRAVRDEAPGRFAVTAVPEPAVGPGDVRIRVRQVGASVSRFRPGDQVAVNPNIYCFACEYCLAGQLGLCANPQGRGVHRNGFFGGRSRSRARARS